MQVEVMSANGSYYIQPAKFWLVSQPLRVKSTICAIIIEIVWKIASTPIIMEIKSIIYSLV